MQTINLDLSVRSIIPLLHAKQGDVGRKFKVVLTDNLVAYPVPMGAAVSVWYSGPSGQGNYTDVGTDRAVTVSGNEITVELITQMLANYGEGHVCLVISAGDGDQIGMWNIPYVVEPLPGMGSEAAKSYFTAFSKAIEDLADKGGVGNEVISEACFISGKGNFVGLKGYYYSNIDFEAKTITLSTKQLESDGDGIQLTWEVGDKVTIVNNRHYDRCSTITAINGNVITVDAFPFTEFVPDYADWDDYSIFVPDKPKAGVVDLGKFATAIGEGNVATERTAIAIGKDNIVQGKYDVALGRGNIIKAYAGRAFGVQNTVEEAAQYASTDGVQNTVTAPLAHAGGSNSEAKAPGADADGYKCVVEEKGEWGLARNYKTKVTAPYAVALNEETEAGARGSLTGGKGTKTVEPYQTSLGKYNNPTTNYLFNIGCGTSDANRLNALAVHKDGILNVFRHRIQNVGDAINVWDAVNLGQLNAGLAEKAPAGHVANYIKCTSSEAVDNAIKDEWSKMADNSIRHIVLALNGGDHGLHSGTWHVTLNQTSYAYGTVTAINYYYNGMTAQRSIFDGTWGDWEWVNPPMVVGEEYRTTERWNGKTVYTQLVNFGTCPLSSTKSLTVKIGKHRPSMMVDILGVLFDQGDLYVNIDNADGVSSVYTMLEEESFDWDNLDEFGNPTITSWGGIMLTVTNTNNYYNHYDVYFTLKYTKD